MASGLDLDALPWPMVFAARPAGSPRARNDPENALSGSFQFAPSPKFEALLASRDPVSREDRPVNAVPQDCAKSLLNGGCAPSRGVAGTLLKMRPPTLVLDRHGIGVSSASRHWTAARRWRR